MDPLILGGIVTLVTNIVTALTSWFFARRKYDAEVDNTTISNLNESLKFYKTICDDTKERLEEVIASNKELRDKVVSLTTQVTELKIALSKYENID